MRILITNPGNIGDFVIRQPLFEHLAKEGHELLLAVRPAAAPLAAMAAPAASVVLCPADPYAPGFADQLESLKPGLEKIAEFRPELVVIAPYRRSRLDEHLASQFPEVPSLALDGGFEPGPAGEGMYRPTARIAQTVAAAPGESEHRKTELLCSAITGANATLPPPVLNPPAQARERARARLERLGLESGRFWIFQAGRGATDEFESWGVDNWVSLLDSFGERHGLQILFAGTSANHAMVEEIHERMAADRSAILSDRDLPVSIEELTALAAGSAGYIGEESGMMHIAAAVSKPVVAVFGAAQWPRFVPPATRGAALTVNLPCAGCDWKCHLPQPSCIHEVPASAVFQELERTLTGDPEFRVIEVPPAPALTNRLAREASEMAREQARRSLATIRNLRTSLDRARFNDESVRQLQLQNRELAAAVRAAGERALKQGSKAKKAEEEAAALRSECEGFRSLLVTLKQYHTDLTDHSHAVQTELDAARHELSALGEQHRVLGERYAAAEALLESVKQSFFTKLLRKAGIWRIFD